MSGIDDWIAGWSDSTSLLIVMALAVLLGLRHAGLIPTTSPQSRRSSRPETSNQLGWARRLGLLWGLGHATTLVLLGVPIILFSAYLPEAVQRGTETAVGVMIIRARGVAARPMAKECHAHARAQHVPTSTRPRRRPSWSWTRTGTADTTRCLHDRASYTERAARPASDCCCWRGSRTEPWQSPRSSCSHSALRHRCRSCRPDGERHSATVPRGDRCTA